MPKGNQRPWDGKSFPAASPKLSSVSTTPPSAAEVKALVEKTQTQMKTVLGADAAALDGVVAGSSAPAFATQGLAEWLNGRPRAALYFFSKAAVAEPGNVLVLNNYSSLLTLHGYPHIAVPLLSYVNQQQPGDAAVLGNLAVAFWDLGSPDQAMAFADEALAKDPRHFVANKVRALAMTARAGGNPDAATRTLVAQAISDSLASHYDAELETLLEELGVGDDDLGQYFDTDDGREFRVLKATNVLPVPTALEETRMYRVAVIREQEALRATSREVDAKQRQIVANKKPHFPQAVRGTANKALVAKADAIIKWADKRRAQLEQPTKDEFNATLDAIRARYDAEASGRTDCAATNSQHRRYLAEVAPVLNDAIARLSKIYRDHARDRANWYPMLMAAPYGNDGEWFLAIQDLYIADIVSLYTWVLDEAQPYFEVCEDALPPQTGPVKQWEDAFCSSFKLQFGVGPAKVKLNCDSFAVEGGEGFVGGVTLKVDGDGRFKELTLSGGVGAAWHLGSTEFINAEAEASVKPFVTLGFDGDGVGVSDLGVTGELTAGATTGDFLAPLSVGGELTVVELSASLGTGVSGGGALPDALGLNL